MGERDPSLGSRTTWVETPRRAERRHDARHRPWTCMREEGKMSRSDDERACAAARPVVSAESRELIAVDLAGQQDLLDATRDELRALSSVGAALLGTFSERPRDCVRHTHADLCRIQHDAHAAVRDRWRSVLLVRIQRGDAGRHGPFSHWPALETAAGSAGATHPVRHPGSRCLCPWRSSRGRWRKPTHNGGGQRRRRLHDGAAI